MKRKYCFKFLKVVGAVQSYQSNNQFLKIVYKHFKGKTNNEKYALKSFNVEKNI